MLDVSKEAIVMPLLNNKNPSIVKEIYRKNKPVLNLAYIGPVVAH